MHLQEIRSIPPNCMDSLPSFSLQGLRRYAALGIVLLACQTLHALDPNSPLRHFGRRVWQTDDGLPQNTVNSILQTQDGYLWIGTNGGLARFDGIQFQIFNRRTTPELRSNQINSLYQDTHGVLWVSTAKGLVSLGGNHWSRLGVPDGLPDDNVSSVYEDRRGVLWILTAGGLVSDSRGVIRSYTVKDGLGAGNVISVMDDADGVLWIASEGGIDKFINGHFRPAYQGAVIASTAGPNGEIWVAAQDGLLAIAHGRLRHLPHSPALPDSNIALLADHRGNLWIGTPSGLTVWKPNSVATYTSHNGLPEDHVSKIYEDREGAIWVSTNYGVTRFTGNTIEVPTQETLSAPQVLDMFEDREGSLWLGTDAGGLTMLRNQKFTSYTAADGLAGDDTKAVFEDRDHAMWIGTDGGGLSRLSQQKFTTINAKNGLSSDVVLSLADDSHDGLWVGTPDGLNHLQRGRTSLFTSANGLADDFIRSLLADKDGSLWIGTSHGLSHRKNGRATNYTKLDGLSSDFIGALVKDAAGNLWIGTLDGLDRLKQGRFSIYTVREGLSNNLVTSVYADSKGAIWIGTKGGSLNRMQDGRIFSYDGLATMPENIYGIVEDDSGHLWLSSDRGIFSASLTELNDFADGRSKLVNIWSYGTADGMPTSQCSGGGHPAVWKSHDGTLWFTTRRGIASIQPDRAIYNKVPPPVAIEQVEIDDEIVHLPASPASSLSVSPGHTRYAFRYAGLSFIAPQNVRFRYRLAGFDKSWIYAGARRQAYYTNLKPGNYRFQVLAANNDNVWNENGASFYFQVQPHFYQSSWFYVALCALLGLMSYEVYRLRMRRIEVQFNAVLAERNRIAREIHDTLAQGFVGVSLQLEVARRMLDNTNLQVKQHLEQALALASSSLSEARRSIWDLRSAALGDQDFPSRLSGIVAEMRKRSVAEISLKVNGAFREMPEAATGELLKIAQESILNAVRHAGASHIGVVLAYEESKVRMIISDDGRGFLANGPTRDELSGHFGITGMRERAKVIHATFHVESNENQGTAVVVEITA